MVDQRFLALEGRSGGFSKQLSFVVLTVTAGSVSTVAGIIAAIIAAAILTR